MKLLLLVSAILTAINCALTLSQSQTEPMVNKVEINTNTGSVQAYQSTDLFQDISQSVVEGARSLNPLAGHFIRKRVCPILSGFLGGPCGLWGFLDFGDLLEDDFTDKKFSAEHILSDFSENPADYTGWAFAGVIGGSFNYFYSGVERASASWRFEYEYGGEINGFGSYLKDVNTFITQQADFSLFSSSWEMEGTKVTDIDYGIENVNGLPIAYVTLDIELELDEEILFGPDQFLYWNCRITIRGDGSYSQFPGPNNVPASNANDCPTVDGAPTHAPTFNPTAPPTRYPTRNPTRDPTREPTAYPTDFPTEEPTSSPTNFPTSAPTPLPTRLPTRDPTRDPTPEPSPPPTFEPTPQPTSEPTPQPTHVPTNEPTRDPTFEPSPEPTPQPTRPPTDGPTSQPTTQAPTPPTAQPTDQPTSQPSIIALSAPGSIASKLKQPILACCISVLVLLNL